MRTVRARYLVAADGAHSRIRASLGIAMRGPDGLGHVVTALFRAPLWPLLGDHRYGIYSVDDPRRRRHVPARRPRRPLGLRHAGWTRRTSRATRPTASCAGSARAPVSPTSSLDRAHRRLHFAAQLADRFRAGNVFLAGDAAHRVTPRGGTGMNTAIRGGYDLGWKLGWVLRGWAGPELLDTYEAERRPVAAHNVARSADPDGSRAGRRRAARRPRRPHPARLGHAGGARVSTLDLLGPGLTLLHRARVGPWERRGGRRAAGRRPGARRDRARALGLRGGGPAVRPDGAPERLWVQEAAAAA